MTDAFVFQLSVSIPSGMQYEKGDMLNIRGNSPDQFELALDAFNGSLAQKCADAATAIKAAYALVSAIPGAEVVQEQPTATNGPPPGSQQQSGWGNGNQQQSRPQGGGQQRRNGGTPHPEGKGCTECGQVLERKETGGGKVVWRCPQWRWNNGNPNNHTQEWA